MKKLILLISIMTLGIVSYSQTVIKYPFGYADNLTPAYDDTMTVSIKNTVSYVKPGTLTGNMVLSFSTSTQLSTGAIVYLEVSGSDDRTVTFSTGFTAPVLSVDSAKTHIQTFFYDGSKWKPQGSAIKIN